jgi:hypothetical protein
MLLFGHSRRFRSSALIIKPQQIFKVVQFIMSFCVTIFGFLKSFSLSSFCVVMSDFRYHYLSASLYVFAISVVIVENDLENKTIHMLGLSKYFMYKVIFILLPNYL